MGWKLTVFLILFGLGTFMWLAREVEQTRFIWIVILVVGGLWAFIKFMSWVASTED